VTDDDRLIPTGNYVIVVAIPELDMGPFLLTQSNPIHGWIQSMSNSATLALEIGGV